MQEIEGEKKPILVSSKESSLTLEESKSKDADP